MKQLNKYIFESINKFTPTQEWLIQRYNKFNKELFNNELPNSKDVQLTISRTKGTELGCQGFNRTFFVSSDFVENGMYRMRVVKPGSYVGYRGGFRNGRQYTEYIVTSENTIPVKSCIELRPFININAIYVATERNLEDTVIHEMIHLWVSKDGLEPKRAHGKEFTHKCNEIRKLAKEKYNIEYELTTKAKAHDEFEYDDKKKEETNNIIQKNKKRGGGAVGVYIIFDEAIKKTKCHYDKRFFFCTSRVLPKLLEEVKGYEKESKYIKNIYITNDSYEKICDIYGAFKLVTTYKFWNIDNYAKAESILTKNATDVLNENLNEDKKPYVKPEMFMFEIPKKINLSNIDLEDIINSKIDDNDNNKVKGSNQNDKNLIDPSKF